MCGTEKESEHMAKKKIYKIGTWNVRSMSSGKLNAFITEMRENKLDILGISEHRWAGYGHFSTSCCGQIIYSGRERSGRSGVAVFLSKATVKIPIGYKPVNDRIITVRLMGQAKKITLIQVYAPTSASTEEELEEFYETLQKKIDSKKRQDILIIAGDFNS